MSTYQEIEQIIDLYLGLNKVGKAPHYVHKTSALKLREYRPSGIDFQRLFRDMLEYLHESWSYAQNSGLTSWSRENWRFEKKLHLSEDNNSNEKILEKVIAQEAGDDWVNQVPTASGLFGPYSDTHRNIDLVHRVAPGEYEFIELKVKDNPLWAAMEILQYGILYLFARETFSGEMIEAKELLQANTVHLRVLAPKDFYREYSLGWFGRSLNTELQKFANERNVPVKMDFQYSQFASDPFQVKTVEDLQNVLLNIKPVIW